MLSSYGGGPGGGGGGGGGVSPVKVFFFFFFSGAGFEYNFVKIFAAALFLISSAILFWDFAAVIKFPLPPPVTFLAIMLQPSLTYFLHHWLI